MPSRSTNNSTKAAKDAAAVKSVEVEDVLEGEEDTNYSYASPQRITRRGKLQKQGNTPPKIKDLKPADMEEEEKEEEEIVFEGGEDEAKEDDISMASINSLEDDINNAEKDIRGAMEGNNDGGGENNNATEEEEVAAGNGNPNASNMGGADTAAWTPIPPRGNNNKNNTTSSSKTTGRASRASFSSDTATKPTSGKVGNNVRRQQKRNSGGHKKIAHEHRWYGEMKFRVAKKPEGQLHGSIIDEIGDFLKVMRGRDDELAIINASDEDTPAFTKAQLPKLSVFAEEWVHFVGDKKKMFKDNIPDGKSRTYTLVLMIGSQWSPQQLLDKTVIDLQEIGIELDYKKVQELETERFLAILGAYNNLDASGIKHVINLMLTEAANLMVADKEHHYSMLMWGPDVIPFFDVWRGYVRHAPWLTRGKNERTSSWQKMAIHLEYKPGDEDELLRRLKYANKKGLVKKFLGKFAYVISTPKSELPERDRGSFTVMIARHGSVNLSMGVVKINGVIEPDKVMTLHRAPTFEGKERDPIQVSLRDVLMSIKQDGERLFYCLSQATSGDYELVYPGGKGCSFHKVAAQGWGKLPGGHIKFYLLKRGCDEMDVDGFIAGVFDTEEMLSAEGCKLLEDGTVINKAEGEVQDEIAAVDECAWIDTRAGLLECELKEMDKGAARNRDPIVDPKSMAAFNFTKDDHTVKDYRDRKDDDTIKTNDYAGISLGEHTEYAMPNDDMMTTAPSEKGKDDTGGKPKQPKFDWEDLLGDEEDEVEFMGSTPAPSEKDNGGGTTNPNNNGSGTSNGVGAAASEEMKEKDDIIAQMAEQLRQMQEQMRQMQNMVQGSNNNPNPSAFPLPTSNSGESQPTSDEDNRNSASGSATSAQGMGQEGGASARSDHPSG